MFINFSTDVSTVMSNSLVFVGEIGGNDYNRGLIALVPLEKIRTWVPYVVSAIGSAVNVIYFSTFFHCLTYCHID